MERWDCKYFDTCNAPLCPMDQVSLEHGIWYADEEICRLKQFFSLEWIKNQKKIAKRTNDTDTFYTVNMLDRKLQVKKGVRGLDPDAPNTKAMEKKWIESRQWTGAKKKDLTEEEKEVLRERIKVARKKRQAVLSEKTG